MVKEPFEEFFLIFQTQAIEEIIVSITHGDMKLTNIQQDIQITGPYAYEADSYP